MDIYALSRKEPAMLHANSELLFEIIRAAHDPDSHYADRHRQVAYPSAGGRRETRPARPIAAFDIARLVALVRKTVTAVPALVPSNQAASVSCCPQPCC
jgi:hypothetical protein